MNIFILRTAGAFGREYRIVAGSEDSARKMIVRRGDNAPVTLIDQRPTSQTLTSIVELKGDQG